MTISSVGSLVMARYIFVDVDKNKDKVASYQSEETTQGPKGKGIYQSHQSSINHISPRFRLAGRRAGKQASRRAGDDSSVDSNSILCPAPEEPQRQPVHPVQLSTVVPHRIPAQGTATTRTLQTVSSAAAAQPVLCPASPNSQSSILTSGLCKTQSKQARTDQMVMNQDIIHACQFVRGISAKRPTRHADSRIHWPWPSPNSQGRRIVSLYAQSWSFKQKIGHLFSKNPIRRQKNHHVLLAAATLHFATIDCFTAPARPFDSGIF